MTSIVESGFVLSSTAHEDATLRLNQDSAIQVLSPGLDTFSQDRAFAARATDLNQGSLYFLRAYVQIGEEEIPVYGAIDSFSTLQLKLHIESIERLSSGCPSEANIRVKLDLIGVKASELQFGVIWRNDVITEPTLSDNVVMGDQVNAEGMASVRLPINDCNNPYSIKVFCRFRGTKIYFPLKKNFPCRKEVYGLNYLPYPSKVMDEDLERINMVMYSVVSKPEQLVVHHFGLLIPIP